MLRENEVLKSEHTESNKFNILNKSNSIDLKCLNNIKDEKPTFINKKTERNYDTSERRLVFKKSLKGKKSKNKFLRQSSNSTIQIPHEEVKELTDKFNQELNYVKSSSKDSISLEVKVSTKTCDTIESSNKNRKQIFKIVPFSSEINPIERRELRPLTKPCIICTNSYFYKNEYFKFSNFSEFLQGIKSIFEERKNHFTNENVDKLIKLYDLLNYKRNDEVFIKNREKWSQIMKNYNHNTKNGFKRTKRFCKNCIFKIIEKEDCLSTLLDAVHEEDEQATLDNTKKEEILKNISSYFNEKNTKKLMFKPIINKPVDSFNIFDKVFSCEIKEKLNSKGNEIFKELNLNNTHIFNDKAEKIELPIKTKETKSEQISTPTTDNDIKELIKCICSQYDSLITLVKNQNIIMNTCFFLLDQYTSQKKTLNNLLDTTLVNIYDTIMKLTNLNKVLLYQQAYKDNNPPLIETFDQLMSLENLKNVNNNNFNVFDNAIKLMKVICKTIANNYIFE